MNTLKIQLFIAEIDELIRKQLQFIIDHEAFRQLESSWRGIQYLVNQMLTQDRQKIKLKLLNVTWYELSRDVHRAIEFDQSQFFAKVYNNEFGHPGGEPFGLLVGDYYLSLKKNQSQLHDQVDTLGEIGKTAAAAFAPYIMSVSPDFLGLNDFGELERSIDLKRVFQQADYKSFKDFREREDSRFIGLILPQFVLRGPYYRENGIEIPLVLWGNSVYLFAARAIEEFNHSGWFAKMPGFREAGNNIKSLVTTYFSDMAFKYFEKNHLNVLFSEKTEKAFEHYGMMIVSENPYSGDVALVNCASIQKPKKYHQQAINQNANLSSMLHYILCISRFAHYIKIMLLNKVGSFMTLADCQQSLNQWLNDYTANGRDLSEIQKSRFPLKEAKVIITEHSKKSYQFHCEMYFVPHHQFDQIETQFHFKIEV